MERGVTTHGVWLETHSKERIRPATKAAVIQMVKERPERVFVDHTGTITPKGSGTHSVPQLPEGTYPFAVPDVFSPRAYGKIIITVRNNKRKVSCR